MHVPDSSSSLEITVEIFRDSDFVNGKNSRFTAVKKTVDSVKAVWRCCEKRVVNKTFTINILLKSEVSFQWQLHSSINSSCVPFKLSPLFFGCWKSVFTALTAFLCRLSFSAFRLSILNPAAFRKCKGLAHWEFNWIFKTYREKRWNMLDNYFLSEAKAKFSGKWSHVAGHFTVNGKHSLFRSLINIWNWVLNLN